MTAKPDVDDAVAIELAELMPRQAVTASSLLKSSPRQSMSGAKWQLRSFASQIPGYPAVGLNDQLSGTVLIGARNIVDGSLLSEGGKG